MLRRMNDMPSGTIGFEAVGEVDDDDWEDVAEPVLFAVHDLLTATTWLAEGVETSS